MSGFPRTMVGGVSLPRMIAGSNWFLGYSHCTRAKDTFITTQVRHKNKVADILEVFFRNGVNAVIGFVNNDELYYGALEASQRTGVKPIFVSTPGFPTTTRTAQDGFNMDEVKRILDTEVERGATFCLPHTGTTDKMVDLCSREIRQFPVLIKEIRRRGLIPGLSTHLPESIVFADESGLDVETYISIYNAMGFLMPLEVDWVNRLIHGAKKPVLTIKPMAAGQIRPLQGLSFVWSTLREIDMVAVGTMTPDEAQECIDLSLSILERRQPGVVLQETRSKDTVKPRRKI